MHLSIAAAPSHGGKPKQKAHTHILLLKSWFCLLNGVVKDKLIETTAEMQWQNVANGKTNSRALSGGDGGTTADMQQHSPGVESLTKGEGNGAIPFSLLPLIPFL